MAKGWTNIEQQAQATQEQRQRFEAQSGKPMLFVNGNNPGPFTVRFLEQGPDVNNYPVHEYKVPDPSVQGGFRTKRFTCLAEAGQQCPGCAAGLKRKSRGVFNLIYRNRPQYRRGQDGKAIKDGAGNYITDGYKDEVVIANVGGPTAEMLRHADGQYQGLMSRDFNITYSGDTFQAWNLTPVLDAQGNAMATPMTENDMALAAQKHDLDAFMAPPSVQDAAQIVAKYGANSGASQNAQGQVGGVGGAQGTAGAAGAANGFLAGANVPAGADLNAFGAAAGAPAPAQPQQGAPGQAPPPAAPAPAQAMPPQQPPAQPAVPPQPVPAQQ